MGNCSWPLEYRDGAFEVSAMYGSFLDWVSNTLIGNRKIVNMVNNFPRNETHGVFRRVFIGDNGQADHIVGRHLLETQLVDAVLIHNVSGGLTSRPFSRPFLGLHMYFFETYLGAAMLAYHLQLLTYHEVSIVAAALLADEIVSSRFRLLERAHVCNDDTSAGLCFHPHNMSFCDWLNDACHDFEAALAQLERDAQHYYWGWGWPPVGPNPAVALPAMHTIFAGLF